MSMSRFESFHLVLLVMSLAFGLGGCGDGTRTVTVTTLLDGDDGPRTSLREALALVPDGGTIRFDPALDGGEIALDEVATDHAVLRGEVFAFDGRGFVFRGYLPRDYGASALHAEKSLVLDASALPSGITLAWRGQGPARILSVLGDLTCRNLHFRGGRCVAVALDGGEQPYTLARGGAVAVWGRGSFTDCTFLDNVVEGDEEPGRDRGAFGGAIYGDRLVLESCVVGGNLARGFGAAGGGIYSVGGVAGDRADGSRFVACTVSGNRVEGQHAYGGGIYSDGGGPGNGQAVEFVNCSLLANQVADHGGIAESPMFRYYYRGGGFYMSNGSLDMRACTVARNRVDGVAAVFDDEPNMGGGGLGATIGDAHVVESMRLRHSILVGNRVDGVAEDLFTGSLIYFYSFGHNRVGRIDFRHMLVPVSDWYCLSRKFWPQEGDGEGHGEAELLDGAAARRLAGTVSRGSDEGEAILLRLPPTGVATDRIPAGGYGLVFRRLQVRTVSGATPEFLNLALDEIRAAYPAELGPTFGTALGDQTGVDFHGPANTWPSDPANADWIAFWRSVDDEIGERLGDVRLGHLFWNRFRAGALGAGHVVDVIESVIDDVLPEAFDQTGAARRDGMADLGAVERGD